VAARIAAFSAIEGFLVLASCVLLLRISMPVVRPDVIFTAAVFGFFGISSLLRVGFALAGPLPEQNIMKTGYISSLYCIAFILMSIGLAAGFSLMVSNRLQIRLRENEALFRSLVDYMHDSMIIIDWGGAILFANPAARRLIDLKPHEEHVGRNIVEYLHPDSFQKALEDQEAVKADRMGFLSEYRLRSATGRLIWVESIGGKIVFRNASANLVCMRDITERRQAEEEKRKLVDRLQRAEKMETLGMLAGGVAHDLNNVLGIVIGYAELLLSETEASGPRRQRLQSIIGGGERAAAIVQDLLTLARRGVAVRQVLNLNKIVADYQTAPEFLKLVSCHPTVRIETDLDASLLNVSGSPVHIGKSFFNLVSNAAESMRDGGVLKIRTSNVYLDGPVQGYEEIREGEYAVLSVSDTGGGIAAADLKRIFEPFYTKKVMGRSGTGLGLAVVWGSMKDHRGYVDVQSEVGSGSIFSLYFPAAREEISVEPSAVAETEYMGRGESILVVDDVRGQCELATEILRRLNYSVEGVCSGEEAVEYIRKKPVDLLVLDMIMDPGMDGLDTYGSVLKVCPRQKAIIVSGFSETDRVAAAQALGAGSYVKKPYVREELGLAVRRELDKATSALDG
jgi:PAS domain S-box-containing protein